MSPRFTFKHNQRSITTLTTPPGAPGFANTDSRKQVSEPRRLATESSPSLNGEGSTRSAVGKALRLPDHKRAVGQVLSLPDHARVRPKA